jgi:NADH-quinone oxidoreductase subunit N
MRRKALFVLSSILALCAAAPSEAQQSTGTISGVVTETSSGNPVEGARLGITGTQLSGTTNGYASAMFYIVVYVLMSLGAFGMILLLSRAGFEADNLDDFKGLNQRSPWYAAVMAALMLSLAGLPPMVGFYAKLAVLSAVVDAGFLWLAVVAVLFSLVGAFYYLRIIRLMYFDEPVQGLERDVPFFSQAVLLICALVTALFFLYPAALLDLATRAAGVFS